MTVQNLIDAALRQLGVIASGESPSAEETADALATLNDLIATWNAQGLPIPFLTRDPLNMTGAESYAFGTRPLAIRSVNVYATNGASEPARIVKADEWGSIRDRSRTGLFAEVAFYDGGYPTGTLYLSPKPANGGIAECWVYRPLAAFAATSDVISLPPGYQMALRYNLALALAPEYVREASQTLIGLANDSKTSIQGLNASVLGTIAPPAAVAMPAQ